MAGMPPDTIRVVLYVLRSSEESYVPEGTLLLLDRDEATIGRGDQADIVLPDRTVSRLHARLEVRPDSLRIVRLAKENGLFVDKDRVEETFDIIEPSARLQLGGVVLRVERFPTPSEVTTHRIEQRVSIAAAKPDPSEAVARWHVRWDGSACAVSLDGRELDLSPLPAAFFGLLLETPAVLVHKWDLEQHLGARNFHQVATVARHALQRRVDDGELDVRDLVEAVKRTSDATFDETDLQEVLRMVIGNQRGQGYVARVAGMGVRVEQV